MAAHHPVARCRTTDKGILCRCSSCCCCCRCDDDVEGAEAATSAVGGCHGVLFSSGPGALRMVVLEKSFRGRPDMGRRRSIREHGWKGSAVTCDGDAMA